MGDLNAWLSTRAMFRRDQFSKWDKGQSVECSRAREYRNSMLYAVHTVLLVNFVKRRVTGYRERQGRWRSSRVPQYKTHKISRENLWTLVGVPCKCTLLRNWLVLAEPCALAQRLALVARNHRWRIVKNVDCLSRIKDCTRISVIK